MPNTRFDGLVDLMLTVGYVDGVFHQHEKEFVRAYLDQLVAHLAIDAQREHFDAVYARLETEIAALAAEVMASGDEGFVKNRLKVRAVALFRSFDPADQVVALELVNGLVGADGTVHPIERALHEELLTYFRAPPPAPPAASSASGEVLEVGPSVPRELTGTSHPLLDPLERPYTTDAGPDYELIFAAITTWERQRARGNQRLKGVTDIGQLPPGTRLLDGHVHVMRPDRETELLVIGDLHGCYGSLKAALLQADFFERVKKHQEDPTTKPDVILVLLGDYLDRGKYGFDGVLRAALTLLVAYPNNVIMLRGNHELLMRHEGGVVSAVAPAEAMPALAKLVSVDILEAYRHLFEHMPTSLLFDRTLFVHAGIPRDETLADRYRDLASLDDAVLRFEMMWSDPVDTEHVPAALQRESTRFTFGRTQFRAFMEKLGLNALIRGHEQVETGFRQSFEIGGRRLYTLFSAGGADNDDLPEASRYRSVTPMALTIRRTEQSLRGTPWPIRYEPFCKGENNGFYR